MRKEAGYRCGVRMSSSSPCVWRFHRLALSHCGPNPFEVWLCIPETTGRFGSSILIADETAFSHVHAWALLCTGAMQLHSLPRSQASIASRSFARRTKARAKRPAHMIASGSVIRFMFSTIRGAKSLPDIHPVTSETMSLTPCFSARDLIALNPASSIFAWA